MALNLLSLPQIPVPSAAASIALVSPGSAWGNSAYSEFIASISACVLAEFSVRVTSLAGAVDVEVDIATGAAASETIISTFRFGNALAGTFNTIFRLPIGIDNIGNNARLSGRIRNSTTAVVTINITLIVISKPVTNTWLTTTQPVVTLPPAADSIVPAANAVVWSSGNYTQLRTNSGAALVLLALINYFAPVGPGNNYEIDVATGGAGSETVITTINVISASSNGNNPGWSNLSLPLDNIAINTRIALRLRSSVTNGSLRLSAMAIEKPL
jgi:hypothetical protein